MSKANKEPNLNEKLVFAQPGWQVRFAEEKLSYTVQARGERYLVCTKPFNPRRTVIYTIVDLQEQVRGTENLVFGFGAETRYQCEEMLFRLEHDGMMRTEVSRRNRVPLLVKMVKPEN